jgi:hypothetical protein
MTHSVLIRRGHRRRHQVVFDNVGFDVVEYDAPNVQGSATPDLSARAIGPNTGGLNFPLKMRPGMAPSATAGIGAGQCTAHKVGAAYEGLLAIFVYSGLGQDIPAGGWGHDPTSNGADVISVDKQGNVYLWDSKARSRGYSNRESKTFTSASARQKALIQARDIIQASGPPNLPLNNVPKHLPTWRTAMYATELRGPGLGRRVGELSGAILEEGEASDESA